MSLLDILDFGNDFFGGSSKKQKIKQKEYLSQDVDYYTQGLDNTGIKVSDPGRWSDEDEDEDGDEKRKKVDISQVGSSDESLTPSEVSNLDESFSGGLSSSSSLSELDGKFVDYNTSLQNAGFKDRSDSFLGRNFGISLAAVPSSAKEVKKDLNPISLLSTEKGRASLGKVAAKKAMAFAGFNPLLTGAVGSFITGRTVQDPLGNASYRPDHVVAGAVMDMNFSIQSNNIGQSIAAMNANNLTGYRGAKSSTGFFGYIGGQLVSRGPNGRTYTGTIPAGVNMKDYEALAKGYAPLNYDMGTETGQYSMSVMTGRFKGYDERGYYADVNGFAGSGLMSDVRATAEKYGIKDEGKVITALEKVRSQYTFFGNLKDDVKDVVTLSQALAEVATAESDKKAGIYSTPGSELGDAAGSVGSTGDLGGATGAGYSTPSNVASASSYDDGPGDSSPSGDSGSMGEDSSGGGYSTAKGGFVSEGNNFALGGKGEAEPAGFIEGPPEQFSDQTTIADDIPLKVKDGTFVINAPAVEYAGSIDVQKMLAEGYQKAMVRDVGNGHSIQTGKIPTGGELDIQISRGEVVVPPHVAKAIGYDRLEKINNRGKREVERRQKAGNQEKVQAGQGFAAGGGEQKIKIFRGEPYPEQIGKFDKKYMAGRRMTGAWFSSNKNYAKNYGDLQKTLDVTFDEYAKGARKAELYRNIGIMQSDSFSDKDYREKKGVLHLTKKQRQQLFKHVKEIKQFAKMVQDGKADPKRFVNSLHMSIFPDKKEQATIRKIESYKNNPKLFAKFVVRGLANNIVNKGIPLASKAIPGIGALAGFSPEEMGDATISGKEGFIYNYTPIKDEVTSFAEGGFAATGGEQFGVNVQPITREQGTFTSFKNFLKKSKPLRSDIEQFIDTIPGDKSRLGILAGVEAPLASSTLPELEAIIQTILNRVDDTTYEYRNINTIKDIMKQRSSRGTGSKMFMYDGLERKHITPRLKEIVQNPKVFQAGLDAAENVLTKGGGEPDYETSMLPKDVFQYSLEGKPSAVNNNNPKLKFYKKIGKHNFYKRIPQ